MNHIEQTLAHVIELNASAQPQAAEDTLRSLLGALTVPQLHEFAGGLREATATFLPKRRRQLAELIAQRIERGDDPDPGAIVLTGSDKPAPKSASRYADARALRSLVRSELDELSHRHIFQWSTYYRDAVVRVYGESRGLAVESKSGFTVPEILVEEFARHSQDVFTKGYEYQTANSLSHREALEKAFAGLRRFLELPVEAYVTDVSSVTEVVEAQAVRSVCSSMLLGVLEGVGACAFGTSEGWQTLAEYTESWRPFLPFLTADHLPRFAAQVPSGQHCGNLRENLEPLLAAIDSGLQCGEEAMVCLPAVSAYSIPKSRFEVSLALPASIREQRFVEVHAYVEESAYMDVRRMSDEVQRGEVHIVSAPFRDEQMIEIESDLHLRSAAISTSAAHSSGTSAAERIRMTLERSICGILLRHSPNALLTYNFARDFPLEKPALTRFFRVHRASIRTLVRGFERQNGVRLWCSPRKSGKTIACLDLGGEDATAIVVQTTSATDQAPGADSLYQSFRHYLEAEAPLPPDFLDGALRDAAGLGVSRGRTVLIIDEYETLFERLRLAASRNPELKYTVVQPLLDQMVAFAQANLLVLVGMWPDAHYVVMEQNQLSAYVEQQAFPLFAHMPGSLTSEFATLVTKVLGRIPFDESLVDAVFEESDGHPYLTVNVLRDMVDWLISRRRRMGELELSRSDFAAFAEEKLTAQAISLSREYDVYHRLISQSLGDYGRRNTPWVHAVFRMLKCVALASPGSMAASVSEFDDMVGNEQLDVELGYDASGLLRSASLANFLRIEGDTVSPRIRLMGRIAAVSTPAVDASR